MLKSSGVSSHDRTCMAWYPHQNMPNGFSSKTKTPGTAGVHIIRPRLHQDVVVEEIDWLLPRPPRRVPIPAELNLPHRHSAPWPLLVIHFSYNAATMYRSKTKRLCLWDRQPLPVPDRPTCPKKNAQTEWRWPVNRRPCAASHRQ